MPSSQYLIQALRSRRAPPPAAPPGPDFSGLMQQAEQARTWGAANPGQSYLGHNIHQAGQNLQALPGRIAALPGQIAAIPGNVAQSFSGLLGLGRAVAGGK